MAFFRQLKLLLWKNGLGVIRQPLWSITLITWPLIIFILIAVTRHHFTPVVKDTCYVGPRNLPSTGFFPFLQTLLCNTDSKCHNTSRLAHSEASKSSRERRSANLPKTSPLASLMQGKNFFSQAFPDDPKNDPAELVKLLENIVGSSTRAKYQNVHLMNALNTSFHDQEAINTIMESVNVFKKAICTVAFPLINQTSPNTISNAMVTFCNSNTTALEASLQTMNKIFEDLLLTSPEEMMTMGGEIVVLFDQLQNETSLWDTLLAFPEVFTSDSFDDMLNNTKTLLSNMQRLLRFFQTMSPDTADLLYQVHAVIDNTIDVIHYVQNWPGKGVSITLGDIVTLRNNSVSDIVKQILQEVDIPLHQAVALMWDKDMVNSYLCDSSNNTIWLTAACSTGTVDMLLSWICPEKLAMEVFLAWTKHVAADDVSFVRDLVQSLMGVASSGKQDPHRSKRSMDAEPQSDEEELFLGVTQALLEITKIDPELDMVVHRALKTSFQSMKATRVALVTVQKVIGNVMEDTRNLQMIYHMLMTNQSAAAAWFSRVALSVVEVIQKAVEHEECEEVFESFEWLLPSETANMNVWRSMFCQNISALNTSLLMDWNPVVQKAEEVYLVLTGQSDFNLTLSMMLSEWNELYNASMQFGEFMDRLISQFGQEGWMNWFPNQYPHDIMKTLQQSLFMSMANLGEELEKSDVWPEVKDYFHSIYWILNYRPGVEKEPPNCFVDADSLMFQCDTGLQWPKFVKAITDAVMSPNENVLVNALKGTVNLLQHVYGDMYKNLTATYLKEEFEGGDALSAYLTKLILNLDGFLQKLTVLPDRNISDPAVIGPLIIELLESAGLKPLQPLLFNSSSVNASTVLDAVLQIIRLNQQIFTFGETDTSMKGLEQLIMQFLSMEGNMTLSFSNILGQSLLAYSASINPKNVSFITEVLHQFTNQTFDEAILDVVELLKTLSDSPNDLSNVLLGYLLQLRNVVTSLIRLQRIEYVLSSNGQLTAAQVTDLQTVSINFLNLLDPENPQGLTQVGPDVAQEHIIQKLLAFLPPNVQKNATDFLQNFKALQDQFTKCEEGENCLQGISEIPTLLNQIIEVLLTASGDVTISISPNSTVPLHLEQKELTTLMFSLMLSPNDAAHVETFKETLNFIKHIIEMENITAAIVQNALMQSNLTRNDLFEIATLLGASSLDDFIAKIFNIYTEINKNCSGPQSNLTSNCFLSIVNGATSFLTNIPALRNETTLLSFIPVIVSETLSDFNQVDLSSDPDMAVVQTLEAILNDIKWILQMNQQNSSDIMNEITMVDHLIELVTDRKPFNSLNNTMRDPLYAQKLLLELVDWYIARVEMITSNSSVSEYLHDFFYFTRIQVATQLAQTEFTMYVNEKTLFLVNSLKYPLNGGDIRLIGKTTIDIIRHLLVFMNTTVQLQDNIPGSEQLEPIGAQIRLYLDLIEKWMEQPNIPELLTSMLQWGNSSMSTPVRDLNFLLQTMSHLLNHNQKEFLWIITNLTESLNNALTVAEQPGGLQSDGFMSEILTALNTVMQIRGPIGGPLPSNVQQHILEIVNGSLTLIVNQNMSFVSSLNISLLILERTENIIQQTVLQNYSEYLLPIVKLVTTYFESISTSSGQDQWNQLILDEMKTIQSILPPNSTAQYYVHVLTEITEFILYPNHGNMSLWERFEGLSMETLPEALGQIQLMYLAEQPGGLQSDRFVSSILTALHTVMQIRGPIGGPLPSNVQQDILEIVNGSLTLIVNQNMSFASSLNISLLILEKTENIIQQTVLQNYSEYLLPIVKLVTTYFESISTSSGQDQWNQLILDEMKTIQSILPPNSTAQYYVHVLTKITEFILYSNHGNMSLWERFEGLSMETLPEALGQIQLMYLAEQPGGLQSDRFVSSILTALHTVMQIRGPIGGPLPSNVQQDILEIVNGSLTLIVNQNMSFASSLNISLLILEKTENIIQQTMLQNYSEYLLPIVKLVTTYFESISTSSGQDQWNQLILDEMKTIQSILPPNSTAQYYVHVLTKITEFILYPNHGNMSLWESFEGLSMETLPEAFGQFTKLVGMFVQLVTEGPPASSFDNLRHIVPVLEQVMTGNADQQTWVKLEQMLKTLLGAFEGQETWNNFSSVMPLLEKLTENVVKIMRANSEMLQSLQVPLVALMRDIVVSANSSHLNISELTMKMQLAVEGTLQAAQQANGTLNCSEALKAWQPVGEAAGVKLSTVVAWCDSSLQPVLEAYAASQAELSHLNMSHMSMEPISVSSAAGRMVKILQSLYHVSINHTHVIEQFIMTLSSELPQLTGLHLSYEGQNYWNKQLQDMQLQSSLADIKELSDELLDVAPFLQPHVEAAFIAMSHILDNYHLNESSSSSHELIQEAAMIFLASANITLNDIYPMMSGNASGVNLALLADTMEEIIKQIMETRAFGHSPMIYQAMEHFLATNSSYLMIERVSEMFMWLISTEASQLELLSQTLSKMYEIIRIPLSILTRVSVDMDMEVYEELFANIFAAFNHIVASGLLPPSSQYHHESGGHHLMNTRRKRDLTQMMKRDPMSDIIDMFYIDYPSMFRALSVAPTTAEVTETAHVFFSNPDLNVVMKGTTSGMPWGFNASREETIDATLGMFSFFTHPQVFETPSLDILKNAAEILPEGLLFASEIKSISRTLANESPENLRLMQEAVQTATELFYISPSDPRFTDQLSQLRSEVCVLEKTDSLALLLHSLSMKPGDLCHKVLPSLQVLADTNITSLSEILFQALVGDPRSYNLQSDWSTVLTEALGLNISGLSVLNVSSPVVTFGEMLRNKEAFIQAIHEHMNVDPEALVVLMETPLPNNTETLSWLVNLRYCHPSESVNTSEAAVLATFCTMTAKDWYKFSLLTAEHVNTEKLVYKAVFSEELQGLVGVMAQVAKVATEMMTKIAPAVRQLESYLLSVKDLNLESSSEFTEMGRGMRRSMSTKATFVTLSRALCSNGIIALFGISKLPELSESGPSFPDNQKKAEMIERFKIPKDASPFCMNMYLDMVNTTGGAIAWAFLKPMLMGQILFTPDTPATRDIMKKANATLHEFANLKKSSEDWIESSNYIIKSAELLSSTLPMLQNSLSNSFVKNFIEMQTDINVDSIKETLSSFSNITEMLHKNKEILDQISTLSNLMVKLSSCIKFDRYRGFDSTEELNTVAQELAKNRELYASVIFKTEDATSSQLPPKVSYTIRMHMDNVMRTDRVRNPYFVRDNHISATHTMRYNRGFVYLQENIDRAIIETQAGQKVTEPAVQLQSFPYPCYLRDEYLEAISFVFPLLLMIPWVLFVADFVKKLVQERELRLHEYMKMMGVNPVSHFFAWFLECASFLLVTIIILTLVLKCGNILPKSDGFLIFLYICDFGLSILSFCYLISSFFDKTYIAGLSGSLIYILSFFPFIVVMSMETNLNFSQKSALSLFSPTCFSYASQYISRYEAQGEGIQWSNSYSSPIAGDTATFGWLCWLLLIDSILYFLIGAYIRMVFPGKYGIPAPWYFPFQLSFWTNLCSSLQTNNNTGKGLLFSNIMQDNQPVFADGKGKGKNSLSYQSGEDFSDLPVGVSLHGLTKLYDDQAAIQNLNVNFHEGHVTSLLGHNGAGKTTTMSLLTGLYPPTSGSIEVYGKDMQRNMEKVRRELGVCMQYDVLFDYMTVKEHLLLYGQIKAPHWSQRELREQVRTILGESDMYAHRHKRADTLSGGMRRKLSISIAFIGGSRLVVLDEPTTGVDPCSRRSIWDIIIQHKKNRTIIMSTHHLDEAEVVSDRIAFLERGGLKCCGSPFYLKDKLGQGYKLTLTKKIQSPEAERVDSADLKAFIQAHLPEARLKETQRGDVVYSLPPFTSSNASSYRSLLTALDANLDDLQLGGYGVSDTTLEEVFLQLTNGGPEGEYQPLSISETVSDTSSIDSIPSDSNDSSCNLGDKIKLTSSSTLSGMALAWQQLTAMLIKRFHHSRRDWKGLIAQILLPVLFVTVAMALGSIKSDLQHYPEMELSPALYNIGPSYSFFSNQNPRSSHLVDTMMSFPGIDNACLDNSDNQVCTRSTNNWSSRGNISKPFSVCKCNQQEQICNKNNSQPPYKKAPSSQIVYNLTGFNVENYLVATANDFIRNRYGGFTFGMPLPPDLRMDLKTVPNNRTLSKVWFNPEGHHTMPAYLNSLNNLILRSNIPADKDPQKYAISVSSHPYFGRMDDEDTIVEGMLQILVAMCILTGFSITTASFAIYEVSEHRSGSKRLQHIAGISEPFYWAVNFFYDMVIYLIPVTLTICVIAAFQIPAFTDRQNLGAISLLLVLFGFATFPWMYLLAGLFKDVEKAFIAYVCINLFLSINTIICTSILYFLGQISSQNSEVIHEILKKLNHAFLIFPQFNFGNGLMELARTNIEVQILNGYGIDAYKNPFSTESLGWMFISSFIQGVFFFTLRLLLNRRFVRKVRHLILGRKTLPQDALEEDDEDVATEHLRVASGAASSDLLQINQLTKIYQHLNKKVPAVKSLSVGIPAGECFGLLGVNGAGKTTTFKMLTGDVSPTDGSAQIRDSEGRLVDIMECRDKGINIGYCPQVDALDELLTGEEHLYFYSRIHGISKREIAGVVNYLLKRLELNYHRNIITDQYSCGTRRKLSTALALIGHPQILLLDEPSSGMDPRTKRHLWKIITEEVRGKCAVVLTSHSMEECEALCSRLAIMVKGQFRCLGSLQHIKNRFGSGFTVKMYLAEPSCDSEEITAFMQRRFPTTYLKDQHSAMVEYHVPNAPGGVADIFSQLESNKHALRIKHFAVSQTTLDEVFINFAMGNIGMETIPIDNEDHFEDLDSIKAVKT